MKQEDEFLSVLESHKGIIYKVTNTYCSNAEDKKDLFQEITYQLWKSFDNYNAQYKLSTWIYRIALNVAISFYRKERTLKSRLTRMDEPLLNFPDNEIKENKEATFLLLEQFISELKELDKALMLLYLEEKSYKEISEIIGISESNVGTKINRIKKILLENFSKTH